MVGAQERESNSVNIRNRDDQKTQSKGELVPLETAVSALRKLKKERTLENSLQLGVSTVVPETQLEKEQAEKIRQLEEQLKVAEL